ncbi:MAG: FkbM family methyltransferase [Pseudonocardiaceae bacterium]
MTNPLSVKKVLPRNSERRFKIAKTMAWIFARIVYPLGGKGYTTIVTALIGRSTNAVATFENGGRFIFPCGDSYYSNHLLTGRNYEEDVTFLLGSIYSRTSPCFLDCGANFGYWSSAVSGQSKMANRVVGIEPSLHALPFLRDNKTENNNRFNIEALAIWDIAGSAVGFSMNRAHATSGIGHGSRNYLVETTTVDAIVEEVGWAGMQVVIKLDVEGAEIAAFNGAERTSRTGCIFIYEDHGGDQECRVTRFLLKRNWIVFFLADDHLLQIVSVAQLSKLKRDPRQGYNLVAWRLETELSTYLRSLASSRRA